MKSKIFVGEVYHHRLEPVSHRFRYPAYCYALELGELSQLDKSLRCFGYNRSRPVSLHDQDYLDERDGSIAVKLMRLLRERGLAEEVASVTLVTSARFLGHSFNPVSFYFCRDGHQSLRCVVAEVNNTFGERHLYVLDKQAEPVAGFEAHYRVPKSFYVSPFNDVEGDYDFRFADLQDRLDAQIHVSKEGRTVFRAWLRGRAVPLDDKNLMATLFRFPLNALLTLPRIHLEAAKLFFQKRLPITIKPHPGHSNTVRVRATWLQRQALKVVSEFLKPMEVGHLRFELPDGSSCAFGETSREPLTVRVNNFDFFLRLLLGGDVALGETFTRKDWDCDDVTGLICLFIDNREILDDKKLALTWFSRLVNRASHLARPNHRRGARSNISAHYDLGNRLFSRFLDRSMTYSCAFFSQPGESLERAQQNKLAKILNKAQIQAHHQVLEIGCGWGSFSQLAASQVGCRVTGITLSTEQRDYARQRMKDAGLESRVEILLQDYRDLEQRYDRIVAIEMLEAVGHSNLGQFFAHCERLLKPDGVVVLQVITTPDFSYEVYRRHCDWIQKVIFPGSTCPALCALTEAMKKNSRLVIENLENIGIHYAPTLREWRRRFEDSWPQLAELGYDEAFRRTWNYYLCYCEAGFATRNLGDLQLVLTRPNNKELPSL